MIDCKAQIKQNETKQETIIFQQIQQPTKFGWKQHKTWKIAACCSKKVNQQLHHMTNSWLNSNELPFSIEKSSQHRSQTIIALISYFLTWSKGDCFLLPFGTFSQFCQLLHELTTSFTWSKGVSFLCSPNYQSILSKKWWHQMTISQLDVKRIIFSLLMQ